jgi:hypothetical protein
LRRYELRTFTDVPPSAVPRLGMIESRTGHVYPVCVQSGPEQALESVQVRED